MVEIRETGKLTFDKAIELAERIKLDEWKAWAEAYPEEYSERCKEIREIGRDWLIPAPNATYVARISSPQKGEVRIASSYLEHFMPGSKYMSLSDMFEETFIGMINIRSGSDTLYDCCYDESRSRFTGNPKLNLSELRDSRLTRILEVYNRIKQFASCPDKKAIRQLEGSKEQMRAEIQRAAAEKGMYSVWASPNLGAICSQHDINWKGWDD